MKGSREIYLPLFYRFSTLIVLALLAVLALGLLLCNLYKNGHGAVSLGSNLLLILGLTIAGTLFAACLWCRFRYYSPIHRVLTEMRELRNGTRSEPIPARKSDLIAQVTREYNRLFHALEHTRRDLEHVQSLLERKVDDHTNKLHCNIRQLEKKADTDRLSGLANRNRFQERLEEMFEDAKLSSSDLACLIIDIDNFKTVNDQLGHTVGDNVIAFAGQLLRASIRGGDLAARYGGDEFILLLPGCNEKQARVIAERIRVLFSRESSHLIPQDNEMKSFSQKDSDDVLSNIGCHFSIGIATVQKNYPHSPKHLIELADQALYRVKQNGRNAVATCTC